jgi:DnaJ-class molecular chaperone
MRTQRRPEHAVALGSLRGRAMSGVFRAAPRAQSGSKLRLRGKGVTRGSSTGDLYVELEVRVPDRVDEALENALRDSDKLYTKPLREEIRL